VTGSLDKLLSISSGSLIDCAPTRRIPLIERAGILGQELWSLLTRRNGLYAFESALRIFPIGAAEGVMDLERWNSHDLWRSRYDELAVGCLFFAEDAFGGQFCVRDDKIFSFDPETGQVKEMATSLAQWADRLLSRYDVLTGFPLAHDWQQRHGPLPANCRLVPTIPFVLGGQYSLDNLHALDAVEGMRLRGDITRQIRDLPDGAKVKLTVK